MICCWWCCHGIDSQILRLPYKHDAKTDRFSMMGQFCSWECMKSWNMNSKNVKTSEINQFITLLKKRMTGKISCTRQAPSRYVLESFGGTMNIEEFRKGLSNKWISMPNINFYPLIINKYEQITKIDKRKQSVTISEESKIDDINNSESSTDDLRLKRPIPLKKAKNNLETLMGLKKRTKE
jgi:hypothetical protein